MLRFIAKRNLVTSLSKVSSATTISAPLTCTVINDDPCAKATSYASLPAGSRRAMSKMRPPPPPGGSSGGPPHRFKCPKCQSFLSYTKSDVAEVRTTRRRGRAVDLAACCRLGSVLSTWRINEWTQRLLNTHNITLPSQSCFSPRFSPRFATHALEYFLLCHLQWLVCCPRQRLHHICQQRQQAPDVPPQL